MSTSYFSRIRNNDKIVKSINTYFRRRISGGFLRIIAYFALYYKLLVVMQLTKLKNLSKKLLLLGFSFWLKLHFLIENFAPGGHFPVNLAELRIYHLD